MRLSPIWLDSDKVWKGDERDSDRDKEERIRDEIRNRHEPDTARKWDHGLLLLTIEEEAKPDRAKYNAPQKR